MAWSKIFARILLLIAIIALGLRFFFVQSLFLQTERLSPKLLRGDFVLGLKQSHPERGDVVTFRCFQREICVGKVLGFPGDRLDFTQTQEVRVNESEIIELAFSDATQPRSASVVVSPDNYFIEGDQFGEVLATQVTSVLARILLSVDPSSRKLRWERIGMAIR